MKTCDNADHTMVKIIPDDDARRVAKKSPPMSKLLVDRQYSRIFESWSSGDRDMARRLLRELAASRPRSWFDDMTREEPPTGLIDDLVDLNQYDEYVVKEM